MSELQDMLRVQAKLHRKQGANALGDLFENANKEIEQLAEKLAKANERVALIEQLNSLLVEFLSIYETMVCPEPDLIYFEEKVKKQLSKEQER